MPDCRNDARCQEETTQAAQLAATAKYDEALTIFARAYERVRDPRLLINIGRCHFRLGRAKKALGYYEDFQKAMPNPEPEVVKRLAQYKIEAKEAIVGDGPEPAVNTEASLPEVEPPPAGFINDPPASEGFLVSRPKWRLYLGAGLAGAGVLLTVFGAAALSGEGKCVDSNDAEGGLCNATVRSDGFLVAQVRDGIRPGVGMLVPGLLLISGGIIVAALPSKRPAKAALRVRPGALAFGLAY